MAKRRRNNNKQGAKYPDGYTARFAHPNTKKCAALLSLLMARAGKWRAECGLRGSEFLMHRATTPIG
jgi:hypothetical protein